MVKDQERREKKMHAVLNLWLVILWKWANVWVIHSVISVYVHPHADEPTGGINLKLSVKAVRRGFKY